MKPSTSYLKEPLQMNDPIELDATSYAFNVGVGGRDNFVIGMVINTSNDQQYLVTMDIDAAQNVGTMLLGHVAAIQSVVSKSPARV